MNKRSTDLVHVMYALNDYEVPKIAFFGFTCPLTFFISYNWWCVKLNTDKNNSLFLIFSCALLCVMRHFLTFLYFWIKIFLNILLGSKLTLAHFFPYFKCKVWRRFHGQFFWMQRYSTKCIRLLSLTPFVHPKRATGHIHSYIFIEHLAIVVVFCCCQLKALC